MDSGRIGTGARGTTESERLEISFYGQRFYVSAVMCIKADRMRVETALRSIDLHIPYSFQGGASGFTQETRGRETGTREMEIQN